MTTAERARKHRAKLREDQCSRLELWIARWIVDGIRQLAKSRGRATWEEVQDVLERHLIADTAAARWSVGHLGDSASIGDEPR
jgi:hypothetical protein